MKVAQNNTRTQVATTGKGPASDPKLPWTASSVVSRTGVKFETIPAPTAAKNSAGAETGSAAAAT